MNFYMGRSSRKCLLYVLIFIFLLFLILAFRDIEKMKSFLSGTTEDYKLDVASKPMKYILLWTDPKRVPFMFLKEGQTVFIEHNCPYTNCYVTSNRTLLGDYTNFDVIAFDGGQIIQGIDPLPTKRSEHQKYVFASIESSDSYPVCNNEFDSFFNWTWTYKLDSDARWGYLVVRDDKNIVVGPNKGVNWMKVNNMDDINATVKEKLRYKSKAVAWLVSDCVSQSRREVFAGLLHQALAEYGLVIDVFGACGRHKCPRRNMESCFKLIEDDYYFYLVLENALSEDFVSDEILIALNHLVVPVVFGGADYSRTTINKSLFIKTKYVKEYRRPVVVETKPLKDPNLKYILLWTNPKAVPFVYMGIGQQGYIDRKCPYTNCYVTDDRRLLGDYTEFDIIAFCGPEVVRLPLNLLPKRRSPHQKFAFATIESADNYPVCHKELNNFFNWTWTYKLDSDARWGYIVVRDADNKIIGPNVNMNWMKVEDMLPTNETISLILKKKSKAAAWFVSNCYTRSSRERFVKEVQAVLSEYGLKVDIYGTCGSLKCSRDNMDDCLDMIQKDYYFYFSFENSFSEDYVTEKLLHGLKHYTVPVVFGGANYTRFMPDGIYLNAKELGPGRLAQKMYELIKDPKKYEQYFRWHNHYKFHRRIESLETDDYCRFCSMLNEEELVKKTTIYKDFKAWWTPPGKC